MQGLLVDQWTLWSQRTGIEVKLQSMDWAKAQKAMLAGQADVIDAMFKTEDRQALYDFSAAYARIEVPVFFHQSISGIVTIPSTSGETHVQSDSVNFGDSCLCTKCTSAAPASFNKAVHSKALCLPPRIRIRFPFLTLS